MDGKQCGGEEGICDVSVQAGPCTSTLERKKPEFVNVDKERLHELT